MYYQINHFLSEVKQHDVIFSYNYIELKVKKIISNHIHVSFMRIWFNFVIHAIWCA